MNVHASTVKDVKFQDGYVTYAQDGEMKTRIFCVQVKVRLIRDGLNAASPGQSVVLPTSKGFESLGRVLAGVCSGSIIRRVGTRWETTPYVQNLRVRNF